MPKKRVGKGCQSLLPLYSNINDDIFLTNVSFYYSSKKCIEEADSLCHGNWIEIEKQYNYILELQKILDEHGIDYPVLL